MSEPLVRFFLSYSGVRVPLRLVEPLEVATLRNRNTYFRATFDTSEQLLRVEKLVYGEVELRHDYEYHANGRLRQATIEVDEETTVLVFDESGTAIS
jgi:hypothetical protein